MTAPLEKTKEKERVRGHWGARRRERGPENRGRGAVREWVSWCVVRKGRGEAQILHPLSIHPSHLFLPLNKAPYTYLL